MKQENSAHENKGSMIRQSIVLPIYLTIISLLPIAQTWAHRDALLNDDSLITLTYARNLGEGRGFIYNAPPATLGTTTPLWALLCGLGHYLLPTIPLTRLAVLLSGLFWLGSIWALHVFRRDFHFGPYAILASAAVLAGLGWPEALGMEAFLFAFLALFSCGLFFRGRLFWSGFVAALLFLTRGEGILLVGIQLATTIFFRPQRKPHSNLRRALRILAGFAIPFFGWAAYAMRTFHNVLPDTMGAKIAQARSGLWPSFWDRFWSEWLPNFKPQWQLGQPWLNIWIVLAILGLIIMIRKRRPLGMLLAWSGLYIAGYSLLGVAAYSWYMIPITWTSGLAAAEAAAFLSVRLEKARFRICRKGQAGWAVLLVFITAVMLPAVQVMKEFQPHPKFRTYLEVCRWLERNTTPGQSVAYFEVGYLGFYTQNRVIDQMGLVTRGVNPDIARRDFASVVWAHEPDYILILSGSGFQYRIVSDPRFQRGYVPAATFLGWGENPLILFKQQQG